MCEIITPEQFRNKDLDTLDEEAARKTKRAEALREVEYTTRMANRYAVQLQVPGISDVTRHHIERMMSGYLFEAGQHMKKFVANGGAAHKSKAWGEIDE